jgi:hypothetical protein
MRVILVIRPARELLRRRLPMVPDSSFFELASRQDKIDDMLFRIESSAVSNKFLLRKCGGMGKGGNGFGKPTGWQGKLQTHYSRRGGR